MSSPTEKKCEYSKCGKPLEGGRKTKRFCNSTCRSGHFREQLGALPEQEKRITFSPMNREIKQPTGLGESATFIIEELKDQRDELKTIVKEQAAEIKTLTKEKNDLEKEVDKLQSDIDKKPSGLGAVFQDKENVSNLIQNAPAILKEFSGLISSAAGAVVPKQLTGGSEQSQVAPHPLVQWIESQPIDIQAEYVNLTEKLMTLTPAELKQKIAFFNKSTPVVKSAMTQRSGMGM